MAAAAEPDSISVHVRRSAKDSEFVCPWADVDADFLSSAVPWRTFRWHKGQKHYSGFPPRLNGVADCCFR